MQYADDPNWYNDYDELEHQIETGLTTRAIKNIAGIESFPRYNAASHTWVGGLIEDLFGRNKAYHVSINSKRRLKWKLYYYNYIFYSEMGVKFLLEHPPVGKLG